MIKMIVSIVILGVFMSNYGDCCTKMIVLQSACKCNTTGSTNNCQSGGYCGPTTSSSGCGSNLGATCTVGDQTKGGSGAAQICGCGSDGTNSGDIAVCSTTEFCTTPGSTTAGGGKNGNQAGSGKCETITDHNGTNCQALTNPRSPCKCNTRQIGVPEWSYCSSSDGSGTYTLIGTTACTASTPASTPCLCNNTTASREVCNISEYCTTASTGTCNPAQCEPYKLYKQNSTSTLCWCSWSTLANVTSTSNNCGGSGTDSNGYKYCLDNYDNSSDSCVSSSSSNGHCVSDITNCDTCAYYANTCTKCKSGFSLSWDSTKSVMTCASTSSVATMATAFVLMCSILFY